VTGSAAAEIDERPPTRTGFGGTALGVVTGGAVLVLLAFTVLDWLSFRGDSTFARIHARLNLAGPFATGLADAYFSWLGWTTFGVVLVVAVLAALVASIGRVLRPVALVLALAGVGLTFWSIKLMVAPIPKYADILSSQRLGFYAAVMGFLLMGIGAAIGPSRRRAASPEPARYLSARDPVD
jgi:hypothetical protein